MWIIYLPAGPAFNQTARSIVAGTLEMLRRVQWNFCMSGNLKLAGLSSHPVAVVRVENEHLGNADQYRVTREVPLPYTFDHAPQDDSDDDEDEQGQAAEAAQAQTLPNRESFVGPNLDRPQSVRLAAIHGESEGV